MIAKAWAALKYYVFLAIGAVFVYFAFRNADFSQMWEGIRSADFRWLGLSFLFGLVAMMSRAQRWRIVLEPLGYRPDFVSSYNGVSMGYFLNIVFPRMGEIVRCTTLSQTNKIPVNQLIGTVVVERVIDVIMLASLILIVTFTQLERVGDFFIANVFGSRIESFSAFYDQLGIWIYIIPVLLILAGYLSVKIVFERFAERGPIRKIRNFFSGIAQGFVALFKMKKKGWFIFHSLFIWFSYFLMTWVCFYAYPPTSDLRAIDGLFIMVVGGLGMTAPVPGGVGTFHLLVAAALGLYGITYNPGITFATMVHSTQFMMTVCSGLFSVIYIASKRRKARLHEIAD